MPAVDTGICANRGLPREAYEAYEYKLLHSGMLSSGATRRTGGRHDLQLRDSDILLYPARGHRRFGSLLIRCMLSGCNPNQRHLT